ncbi:unnamed protein product [Mycetohabitans rhizoxinica HKI 454]|uniref:Uncharacterized protein n=1 Tax=Mycetohabitans rhizoxinica (strain DSM 19002 / CIP 109453 / HKI 454) TaxID=882378 RepID=E5AQG9_MYCRK|nr:unnamed protein product [Mycetohabitans rhizoxinica HKI 454]
MLQGRNERRIVTMLEFAWLCYAKIRKVKYVLNRITS